MKQNISPAVAAIAIVVILGIAALAWMKMGGVESRVGEKPPGMPAEAASKWSEITSGKGPGQGSSTIPSITGGAPGTQPGGGPSTGRITGSPMPTRPGGGPGGSPMPTGPPMGR